jgi:hypothetical protein
MSPRHYCRNQRCRSKLKAPIDNPHHAFCCRGCHGQFYRVRCLVCEDPMQRKRENQRFKSGHAKCQSEYQRFPRVYDFVSVQLAPDSQNARGGLGSAHSTGVKTRGFRGGSTWSVDSGAGDLSLYAQDGLTVARIVLEGDHYHLRSPVTRPRLSWPDLEDAKRGAERIALAMLPLDAKTAGRVARDNSTPHPMGIPRTQPPAFGDAIPSNWKPTGTDLAPEIPDFLKRVP